MHMPGEGMVHIPVGWSTTMQDFITPFKTVKNLSSKGKRGQIYKGGPQKEFIYKKLCIYSNVLKLQSLPKYSPFDAVHLWRHFSTTQNRF